MSTKSITNKKGVNTAIATLVVLGVGLAVPVLGSGIASAASVDTWDKIAQCESGGRWYLAGGHADSTGGLQIQTRTWNDYKSGISSASHAYQASKEDQIRVAQKILADQGHRAWAVTVNGSACHGVPLNVYPEPFFGSAPAPQTPSVPATPTPSKPSQPSTPGKVAAPVSEKYTVQRGDTLHKIAGFKKVQGGWQALYKANVSVVGSNPNLIYPGQKLTIPRPAARYTVKSGDTLSGIALKHKVAWQAIYNVNKAVIGSDPNVIEVGQVLIIPGGVATPAPSTPAPTTPKPTTPKPTTPAPKPTTPAPTTQGWVTPTSVMNITQRYGNPGAGYGLGYHTGIDVSRPQGTALRAVSNATVVHSGWGYAGQSYGLHVVLKLADGKYALYAHMAGSTVSAGQTVSAGEMIGYIGSTGNSSGPHLHFEIRTTPNQYFSGGFMDPVSYLRSKGVSV